MCGRADLGDDYHDVVRHHALDHPHAQPRRPDGRRHGQFQKARCKPKPRVLLEVQATSTNFNAILTLYSETGAALFQVNNNGGGKYSGSKGYVVVAQKRR